MGILNLHKFLERCASRQNLSCLRGQVVGVDAMCWLHRGAVASAWELLTGRDTDKFLRFFVKMLVLCNLCGVKPIIVFDGASLPAKAKEESERRHRRAENTEKAKKEIEEKKISSFGQVDNALRSMIVQSVSISADMITRTMSVLRRLNVDYVVAPYEADAQLAFMYRQGLIAGVVSEDSDLMAFGCHRLISKMDINGDFMDVRLDWAFRGADLPNKPVNIGELGKLEKWSESMFIDLCILSGSDYKLGKIVGIGIKKAFLLLNKFRNIARIAEEVGKSKGWSKSDREKFLLEFDRAKIAFQRHRVFDIKNVQCVTITDNQVDSGDFHELGDIIGPDIDRDQTRLIMTGEIDAKTAEKRFFLDRLPPGVLGVYNSSLRRPAATQEGSTERTTVPPSQYEQLEQQIVKEFEKLNSFRQPEVLELNRRNYLNKLEGMILHTTQTPPTSITTVDNDEFGDLDALLLLDDDIGIIPDDSSGVVIDLMDEEENVPPLQMQSSPAMPVVSRPKNPFARIAAIESEQTKKSRTSVTASIVPHLAKPKQSSLNNDGEVRTVVDALRVSTGGSSAAKEPLKMVSTRTLLDKPQGPYFVRRR